jgi:hypothetical protein
MSPRIEGYVVPDLGDREPTREDLIPQVRRKGRLVPYGVAARDTGGPGKAERRAKAKAARKASVATRRR